jgi:NADH:ubiquinone oxidoreductase subunit 4 (subunit M)
VLAGVLLKLGSYGVFRVVTTFFLKKLYSISRFWLILSLLARTITFFQSDIKKLIAYRRVTHITFIMVALCNLNKFIYFAVILLSLAHG